MIIGIKGAFIFAKLLGGIWLAVVTFSTVLILLYLLTLFYFFYRLVWLFSDDATVLRLQRKFKRHREKLLQEGIRQRTTFSNTVDRKNIMHLVMLVNEEINLRKAHLDPAIVLEIQNMLNSCRYARDFDKVLRIHKIVVDTDAALLNSTLSELLDGG